MTSAVVEIRTVGTVTATVIKCFNGHAYGIALSDTFGIHGSFSWMEQQPPETKRVDELIAQHVRYSQVRTRRN